MEGDGSHWFLDGVERIVGNGDGTSFWSNPWLEGVSLWLIFRHFFFSYVLIPVF